MSLMNLSKQIKKIIPSLYYNVPNCPCCASQRTGRYVKASRLSETTDEWVERESIKNGEYIKVVYTVPDYNCFCLDCGFEWAQDVPLKLMSLYDKEIMKKYKGLQNAENDMRKEMKEKKRTEKTGLFGRLKNTIGL